MADQKKWFKVWTSILDDPHFQELSLEDIGAWVLLGAMTAKVGNRGVLAVPGAGRRLREVVRADSMERVEALFRRLPSVHFGEAEHANGERAVTWKNWRKYQEDSSIAQRVARLRSKRRGEEIRGEESSNPPIAPPASELPQGSNEGGQPGRSTSRLGGLTVDEAVRKYQPLEVYRLLDVRQTVLNCQNWCVTRKKALTDRRLVNWLNGEAMKAASAQGAQRTKSPDPYRHWPRGECP